MKKTATLFILSFWIILGGNLSAKIIDITDLLGVISEPNNDSPQGEGIENIIDNKVQTKYLTFVDTTWVQFDLDKPAFVTGYSITSANDYPERDPSTWEFLGWDAQSSTWVELDYRKDEPEWTDRFLKKEFEIETTEWYSSFRLNIHSAGGGGIIQMAELEIFAEVNDLSSDITNLMGDIETANSIPGDPKDSAGARFLIDNNIATKYSVNSDTIWINYNVDHSTLVDGYAIVSADDKPEGDPSSWEFQGWNEKDAAWVTLHTVSEEPQWDERLAEKRFDFNNNDIFHKYRLKIKAAHGANLIQIAEYRIFGNFYDPSVADITDLEGVQIVEPNKNSPEGEGINKLIDNNISTKYLTFHDTTWIQITAPNATIVTDYTIVSGNDAPERDPSTWEFEAWENFTGTWITLHSIVDEPEWEKRLGRKSFTFDNSTPYNRYRLNIHAAHDAGMIQMSELYIYGQVLETGGRVDITDWMGTISESNANSPENEEIENIIDNDVYTKYLTFATTTWIEYRLQRNSVVTGYAIFSANDAPARDPRDWTFEALNPYTLEWEILHTVANEPVWGQRFQKKEFSFENSNVYTTYRLNIQSTNGEDKIQIAELEIYGEILSDVKDNKLHQPIEHFLYQNVPNPFNPSTQIRFSLPKPTSVKISIYNMMGQRVISLVDQPMNAGLHTITWNGVNAQGFTVASGIYYYSLTSDLGVKTKKMLYLK